MSTNRPYAAVINCVASSRLDAVMAHLSETHARVLVLDGASVHDKRGFLDAFGHQLLGGQAIANWSQFDDRLGHIVLGPDGHTEQALVWMKADGMLHGGLADLITAADSFLGVARAASARGRNFRVFLMGDGPNYP